MNNVEKAWDLVKEMQSRYPTKDITCSIEAEEAWNEACTALSKFALMDPDEAGWSIIRDTRYATTIQGERRRYWIRGLLVGGVLTACGIYLYASIAIKKASEDNRKKEETAIEEIGTE